MERYKAMTAAELIKEAGIVLTSDGRLRWRRRPNEDPEFFNAVKTRKPEIVAYITAQNEAKHNAWLAREAKINAIEGLKEIQTAIADWEKFNYRFNRCLESGDWAYVPKKPESDIEALKAAYPRATAYLVAEGYTMAANYDKASAGKKALERIIDGEDYATALADMKTEWTAEAMKHIWD